MRAMATTDRSERDAPHETLSGIPIDPVFAVSQDQRAMRRKHGLEEDQFTILVSAGGFGVGPVGHLMEALARLEHSARVVAVCGRNAALKAELSEAVKGFPKRSAVAFTLVGFTTEMDELMTAADLFVGKPGGLTTSEALAKGLPMVVINPIPGQEERNSDHLLEEGAVADLMLFDWEEGGQLRVKMTLVGGVT